MACSFLWSGLHSCSRLPTFGGSERKGMPCRYVPICCCIWVFLCAPRAHGESLFLGPPIVAYDVQAVKVDARYTISDLTNKIGKFSAVGIANSYAGGSNNITGGSYRVSVFFDLPTGNVRLSDPGNLIDVTGTYAGIFRTFFHSTTLQKFGSGTEDTFDVKFGPNSSTAFVLPNANVFSRIVGTSISNFHDPTFKYTVTGSNHTGDIIWQNALVGNSKIGTANVWAPAPPAAAAGSVLIFGFGALSALRRYLRLRWRRA